MLSVALRTVLNIAVGALVMLVILITSLLLVRLIEYISEKMRIKTVLRALIFLYLVTLTLEVLNVFGDSLVKYFIKGGL